MPAAGLPAGRPAAEPRKPAVAEGEDASIGRREPVAAAGRGGGHAGDRLVQLDRPGRPEESGVAEGEHAAVPGDEPIPPAGRRGRQPDDRLVEPGATGRSEERGIAEGEHAAVGRHQPVPLPIRAGGHPDDGLVEPDGAGRPEKAGVAESEHAPIPSDEPVPAPEVVDVMHTTGWLRPVADPSSGAEPKRYTFPSAPASQYPAAAGASAARAGCPTPRPAVRTARMRTKAR